MTLNPVTVEGHESLPWRRALLFTLLMGTSLSTSIGVGANGEISCLHKHHSPSVWFARPFALAHVREEHAQGYSLQYYSSQLFYHASIMFYQYPSQESGLM